MATVNRPAARREVLGRLVMHFSQRQLIDQLRSEVISQVTSAVQRTFEQIEEKVFEKAEQARSNQEQAAVFDDLR
ncbi:MAG TPA: hypothetical protein PKO17_07495, partial [Pseudomonadales bacterium]|nr:hypothetical protein [Pseudomonadales bacterium]